MRCPCCKRTDVKPRPRQSKLRFPHQCKHGKPCPGGDPRYGQHATGPKPSKYGGCPECDAGGES